MPIKPVSFKLSSNKIYVFELLEFEVYFDDSFFQLNRLQKIDPYYRHDAYDADEDFTIFRAEAQFSLLGKNKTYNVPVYAYQEQENEKWKWKVRFQPNEKGVWNFYIWVLCIQPGEASESGISVKNRRELDNEYSYRDQSGSIKKSKHFYEFTYGIQFNENSPIGKDTWPQLYKSDYQSYPSGSGRITVTEKKDSPLQSNNHSLLDMNGHPMGPLNAPEEQENKNYFYRSQYDEKARRYKRKPYFLFGVGRPWSINNPQNFEEYIDRKKDVFEPMEKYGCNLLSHWLAPWETQLVHQARTEFWPTFNTKDEQSTFTGRFSGKYGYRLEEKNWKKGYRRYDQGRAKHLDNIFAMAAKHNVSLMLSIFTHQSLQDAPHPWGEQGWGKNSTVQEEPKVKKNKEKSISPSRANGFQIFQNPDRKGKDSSISIKEFFQMNPKSKNSWERKLWKHFANYWRYITGRWGAYPSMGLWVIIDEFEGVGEDTNWWVHNGFNNDGITFVWHSNLLKMIRNGLSWEHQSKWSLTYTGDYLSHPVTSSNTEYNREAPRNSSKAVALNFIKNTKEVDEYKTWKNYLDRNQNIDFYSHHIYQSIPSFGEWEYQTKPTNMSNVLYGKKIYKIKLRQAKNWVLPNSQNMRLADSSFWLWNSFIYRMISWSERHTNKPKLITEFGAHERFGRNLHFNGSKIHIYSSPFTYGKVFPAYTHFAVWAGFILGHAGIPIKWNDGKELGEMKYKLNIIHPSVRTIIKDNFYPINNYEHILPLINFTREINEFLHLLKPVEQSKKIVINIQSGIAQYNNKEDKTPSSIIFPIIKENVSHLALISENLEYSVLWFYNESFSKNLSTEKIKMNQRKLQSTSAYTKSLQYYYITLQGFQNSTGYEYAWFDTWNGVFFKENNISKKIARNTSHQTKSTKNGTLSVSFFGLPTYRGNFKESIKEEADGNDIILVIKKI